ncbi:MAG: N-acetylglucosamine-6-phosphate deacetylase [Kutzneria sp.]|nr:N-acetylglucosamine-6-phosphate deacetylase [Kutzneria sp.]MBV9843756.1 N-acetylglucosamine-6-phosphate deacetylase [Kutzneria sp.]
MPLLRNARLVLPDAVVDNGRLGVDGEWITAIGADDDGDAVPHAETLDLAGHWVVPGFVDMHVHGGGGASYTGGQPDQAHRAFEFHRTHGTTTSIASTVATAVDELERVVCGLSELVEDGLLTGIHLEGPFISAARCGAHDPALLRTPEAGVLRRLLDQGRGAIRMVTVAPELDGGVRAVRQLVDAGVIAALGHTDASYEQARAAIDAGVTVATHLFNAMRGLHHRDPGPVVAALESDEVTVELINDGLHLHDAVARMVFRAAGPHRVALITDSLSTTGAGDGDYRLGPLAVRVVDGVARLVDSDTIAGSTLTMDAALRRAVTVGGIPIEQACRAASTTPAKVLGLGHLVGSLAVGKRADLVVLDADLRVAAVMVAGHWVSRPRWL